MKKLFTALGLLFLMLLTPIAHAITVYYQPTPFPMKKADGTAMPQDLNIVHAWNGWLPSIYYGQTFQRDSRLQVGGWGDQYRTFLKFDLTGLPQSVDQASIWLMPYSRGDSSTPIPYAACSVTSAWDLSLTWNTQPTFGTCYGWYSAPTTGTWSGFLLSVAGGVDWYNQWKNGTLANNGVMLFPQATNNNFDVFYSTLYSNYSVDPYADSRRPQLQLTFTPPVPVPNFQMPLPGGTSWQVTNETGGYECMGGQPWPDIAHQGVNYFSIDISSVNHDTNGNTVFTGNIPVIAAASGVVTHAGPDTQEVGNGNYVIINHNNDITNATGFSTRYLHMQYAPKGLQVGVGSTVSQGQLLGYMGNTGISTGTHLHFGIRYANDGSSSSNVQYATMEGKLLKSYQTECGLNSQGVWTWIRYYPSNNVGVGVYPANN